MTRPTHNLTLAHSPDPDDAFMWWPLTGCVDANNPTQRITEPTIDTGRFSFTAVPGDIAALNTRALEIGDLDITAISMHTAPHVKDRYGLTACGSSFGEGYGPKLVVRDNASVRTADDLCAKSGLKIAVPGRKTTAFLTMQLLLNARADVPMRHTIVELPFDQIIEATVNGTVDVGLVIHEGQLTFHEAGLRLITDLGAWWLEHTELPLPLGGNALRLDLDERFDAGSRAKVVALLDESIRVSLDQAETSLAYASGFAMHSSQRDLEVMRAGASEQLAERVEQFVAMYVNQRTVDMGDQGIEAIARLLREGHSRGLCPSPAGLTVLGPGDAVRVI